MPGKKVMPKKPAQGKKRPAKRKLAKLPPKRPPSRKTKPAAVTATLTKYERGQVSEIEGWHAKEPSVADRTLGVMIEPLGWMLRAVVPGRALMGALKMAKQLSSRTIETEDVKRDAAVGKISDLRGKDLELSDRLADGVHNWGIGLAAAEGAGTGFFGIFGAPIDVPALITIALRTIEKIGICYGYECRTQADEEFILGILAASGANNVEEKLGALMGVRSLQTILLKQSWSKMAETAGTARLGKESAIIGLRALAKQLSINITKRKALAAIPYIGSLIGGSMNAWYIRDVGWAARRIFQERWLKETGKVPHQ